MVKVNKLGILGLLCSLFLSGCVMVKGAEKPVEESTINDVITDTINSMSVSFIDVGQGDSTFIELPDGKTMLIDAGLKAESEAVTEYIRVKGYTTIDYVIATHPDSDHIGGIADVLNTFEVGAFYISPYYGTTNTFDTMLETAEDKGLDARTLKEGDTFTDSDLYEIIVVAPVGNTYKDSNNASIVLRLDYKDSSFLFMGDAEAESEEQISLDIDCDVLKVGHHGSTSSTTIDFLNKVTPKISVISCGLDNKYGHPHKETLEKLEGTQVYRTDIEGTIEIVTDGTEYLIKSQNEQTIQEEKEVGTSNSTITDTEIAYVLNTKTKKNS